MENGHILKVKPIWFNLILNGIKTIEGRLLKDKFVNMQIGDTVVFREESTERFTLRKITKLRVYNNIRDMCSNEPLDKLLPNISTIDEAISIYEQIYTPHQRLVYKVVAIHVE